MILVHPLKEEMGYYPGNIIEPVIKKIRRKLLDIELDLKVLNPGKDLKKIGNFIVENYPKVDVVTELFPNYLGEEKVFVTLSCSEKVNMYRQDLEDYLYYKFLYHNSSGLWIIDGNPRIQYSSTVNPLDNKFKTESTVVGVTYSDTKNDVEGQILTVSKEFYID